MSSISLELPATKHAPARAREAVRDAALRSGVDADDCWRAQIIVTFAACSARAPNSKPENTGAKGAAALPKLKPLDPNNFDTKADPCADIFQFTNGNWIARHPIPAERSSWSLATEIEERNLELLHRILDEAAQANAPQGSKVWFEVTSRA